MNGAHRLGPIRDKINVDKPSAPSVLSGDPAPVSGRPDTYEKPVSGSKPTKQSKVATVGAKKVLSELAQMDEAGKRLDVVRVHHHAALAYKAAAGNLGLVKK